VHFLFYTEPNPFAAFTITVRANTGRDTTFTANGSAGAAGVAFWAQLGCFISSVTVSAPVDFAVGELAIYQSKFGPESISLPLAPGTCAVNVPKPSTICAGFVPVTADASAGVTTGPTFFNTTCGLTHTVTPPVAPAGNSNPSTNSIYDITCGPANLVVNHNGDANFGLTHTLSISGNQVGTFNTSGAAANLRFAIPAYNTETLDGDVDVTTAPGCLSGMFGVAINFRVEVPTATINGLHKLHYWNKCTSSTWCWQTYHSLESV
jgi:hypothetical protein